MRIFQWILTSFLPSRPSTLVERRGLLGHVSHHTKQVKTLLRLGMFLCLAAGGLNAHADDVLIPCDPVAATTAMSVGDIFTCEVEIAGDSDVYMFDVNAGDTYLLTLTDLTNGGLDAIGEILDCVGSTFDSLSPGNLTGVGLEFLGPCTGTMTLLVSDIGNDETGTYHLALQRISPLPAEAVEVCVDCEIEETISPVGDSDLYFFNGVSGTTNVFTVSDLTNGGLDAQLEIRTPSGLPLTTLSPGNLTGISETHTLAETGVYSFIATDIGHQDTGSYNLSVQQLFPTPASAVPINYDETIGDTVTPITDSDVYFFSGTSGDFIRVTITDLTNGGLDAAMEVYGPDEGLITTLSPPNLLGESEDISLTQDGVYTLFIYDSANNDTGSYDVSLQCLFGTCFGFPDIQATPERHNFGSVDVGLVSDTQVFTVSNIGDADLEISNTLSPTQSVFVIANDTCSMATITPGNDCTFEATFQPTANGRIAATVRISSNDLDQPEFDIGMVGTGNGPIADPIGADVFGTTVTTVRCFNLTAGQSITINDGLTMFDCVAGGLNASSGDSIRIIVDGQAE
jgi:hypothetical protein